MKKIKNTAAVLAAAVITVLCFSSIAVSAEKRSQTNVLPDTNTNIFSENKLAMLSEITAEAEKYGNISIYYRDTESGYYFSYKPKVVYPSASTIKAVYCQYLISSGADLDEKIKLTNAARTSSSGKLTKDSVGKYFTVRKLIEYAIVYSDNMAYRLLFERYGYEDFNAYIRGLGLSSPMLEAGYEYADITARSLGLCMKEIYRYSAESGDTFLTELMKRTKYSVQISAGTSCAAAHKYGYKGGTGGYHDAAIVFADEPYILVICSNIDADSEGANEPFVKIAAMVEELHDRLHKKKTAAKPAQQTPQDEDKNVTVHHLSYEEYLEMLDSDGNFEIIDECGGDCYFYVEGVGRIN